MANTFEDQAQERFNKSGAFLGKAQTLLQDDLIARTVLADAVSAIKNMLQGYLLIRISRAQPGMMTQDWQEVAASNRMPELIRTCDDAGLNIRDLGRAIRQLNDQRNYRTHDDPQSRIQVEQARQALDVARTVAQRVNSGIKGNAVPMPRPAPAPGAKVGIGNNYAPASVSRSPVASSVPSAQAPAPAQVAIAPAKAPAAAVAAPAPAAEIADEVEDEGQATQDDTTVIPALRGAVAGASGGRRVARVALRVGALAAVLAVGVVAGFGGAVAIHADGAPSFLGFARPWLNGPGAPTALADIPANGSPSVTTTSQTAGALTASPPTCASGVLSFKLTNGGAVALPWAVESSNGTALSFGFAPSTATSAAAIGTMPPYANITIYATAPKGASGYQIEAFSPGGTIQVVATCK